MMLDPIVSFLTWWSALAIQVGTAGFDALIGFLAVIAVLYAATQMLVSASRLMMGMSDLRSEASRNASSGFLLALMIAMVSVNQFGTGSGFVSTVTQPIFSVGLDLSSAGASKQLGAGCGSKMNVGNVLLGNAPDVTGDAASAGMGGSFGGLVGLFKCVQPYLEVPFMIANGIARVSTPGWIESANNACKYGGRNGACQQVAIIKGAEESGKSAAASGVSDPMGSGVGDAAAMAVNRAEEANKLAASSNGVSAPDPITHYALVVISVVLIYVVYAVIALYVGFSIFSLLLRLCFVIALSPSVVVAIVMPAFRSAAGKIIRIYVNNAVLAFTWSVAFSLFAAAVVRILPAALADQVRKGGSAVDVFLQLPDFLVQNSGAYYVFILGYGDNGLLALVFGGFILFVAMGTASWAATLVTDSVDGNGLAKGLTALVAGTAVAGAGVAAGTVAALGLRTAGVAGRGVSAVAPRVAGALIGNPGRNMGSGGAGSSGSTTPRLDGGGTSDNGPSGLPPSGGGPAGQSVFSKTPQAAELRTPLLGAQTGAGSEKATARVGDTASDRQRAASTAGQRTANANSVRSTSEARQSEGGGVESGAATPVSDGGPGPSGTEGSGAESSQGGFAARSETAVDKTNRSGVQASGGAAQSPPATSVRGAGSSADVQSRGAADRVGKVGGAGAARETAPSSGVRASQGGGGTADETSVDRAVQDAPVRPGSGGSADDMRAIRELLTEQNQRAQAEQRAADEERQRRAEEGEADRRSAVRERRREAVRMRNAAIARSVMGGATRGGQFIVRVLHDSHHTH